MRQPLFDGQPHCIRAANKPAPQRVNTIIQWAEIGIVQSVDDLCPVGVFLELVWVRDEESVAARKDPPQQWIVR